MPFSAVLSACRCLPFPECPAMPSCRSLPVSCRCLNRPGVCRCPAMPSCRCPERYPGDDYTNGDNYAKSPCRDDYTKSREQKKSPGRLTGRFSECPAGVLFRDYLNKFRSPVLVNFQKFSPDILSVDLVDACPVYQSSVVNQGENRKHFDSP